ncbi:hypothetical protein BDM02DRAFT_1969398 [Thelephora ganbajun]|uniref:Uncharacterized protein n=1 Tax=Thelephora ganbajun TaxID=370292 RepID=A0ACB6ZHT6_THEGA|nr:hypothetical protein BDM02DRAFT_1969398 [Thelephora ganbajun]
MLRNGIQPRSSINAKYLCGSSKEVRRYRLQSTASKREIRANVNVLHGSSLPLSPSPLPGPHSSTGMFACPTFQESLLPTLVRYLKRLPLSYMHFLSRVYFEDRRMKQPCLCNDSRLQAKGMHQTPRLWGYRCFVASLGLRRPTYHGGTAVPVDISKVLHRTIPDRF